MINFILGDGLPLVIGGLVVLLVILLVAETKTPKSGSSLPIPAASMPKPTSFKEVLLALVLVAVIFVAGAFAVAGPVGQASLATAAQGFLSSLVNALMFLGLAVLVIVFVGLLIKGGGGR